MIRILIALAISLVSMALVSNADAQQTRSALNAQNNSTITTNGHGAITGAILNSMIANMITSGAVQADSNTFTGANTFNQGLALSGFSQITGSSTSQFGWQWETSSSPSPVLSWSLQTPAGGPTSQLWLEGFNSTTGAYLGSPWIASTSGAQPTLYEQWLVEMQGSVAPTTNAGVVGELNTFTNSGGLVQQGAKETYFSNAGSNTNASGYDVGHTRLLISNATTWGSPAPNIDFLEDWAISDCPTIANNEWGCQVEEGDIINRGADKGLRTTRQGQLEPTTGIVLVPEANTFGQGGNTYNADWGFVTAHSGTAGSSGYPNGFYITFFSAENSVAPGGYNFYGDGDVTSTPARDPYSPFGAAGAYLHGIDMTQATFVDNAAYRASTSQQYIMTDGTNTVALGAVGSGASLAPALYAAGVPAIEAAAVSGADHPLIFTPGKTGSSNATITVASGVSLSMGAVNALYLTITGAANVFGATQTNTNIQAVSGDIEIGTGSALVTTSTVGFLSPPFMNGTPTGVPVTSGVPSCVWNDTSKALDCYSPGAAGWYHVAFTSGGG